MGRRSFVSRRIVPVTVGRPSPDDISHYPTTTVGVRWMSDAACGNAAESFELRKKMKVLRRLAIKYCADCPVRQQCLQYGRETRSRGLFGGYVLRGSSTNGAVQQTNALVCKHGHELAEVGIRPDGSCRKCRAWKPQ